MSVKIRIKRNHVYLDVIQNRKHHWESLHISLSSERKERKEQLRLAELCRAKREMQIVSGEWDFPQKSDVLLSQFIAKKAALAKSESRKKAFMALRSHLLRFCRQDIRLCQVSAQWLASFRDYLFLSTSLKPSSAAAYFALLKTIFSQAERSFLIAKNPARAIKPRFLPQSESEKCTLTTCEVRLLLTSPKREKGEESRRAFLFSLFTALRFSDLKTLSWSDIEERNGVFFLKKQQVKTKRTVEIPLCKTAFSLLEKRDGERVFNLSYSSSLLHLRAWVKECGIKKRISWHTARRTFATLALEQNIDVFTIQRLMGHTKITTTALYAKSDGIKKIAVEKLERSITS